MRRPIASLCRHVIWPALIVGLVLYVILSLDAEDTSKWPFITKTSTFLLIATSFIIYAYGEYLVKDKATGMKSLMLSMGLRRSSYYLANLFIMTMSLLPIVLPLMVLVVKRLMQNSEASAIYVYILFILFILHATAFLHTIISFISSTSYSVIILILIFLEQTPSVLINMGMAKGGNWRPILILLDLMSPFAPLRIFADSFQMNKNNGTIDYNREENMVSAPTYLICVGSLLWTVIFFAFARWFEEVCPWQKDSAVQGPCFCLQSKQQYWEVEDLDPDHAQSHGHYFEKRPDDPSREIGIRVLNLSKSYSSSIAVNDVSFSIFKGETTLLLGHNGAGKSTMMNMILGLLRPDYGRVAIKGYASLGRAGVGVCPQTSILDENLSVKQHLELFLDIKTSIDSSERERHVMKTMEDVSLTAHANKRPDELSGGMKRKLSLGMAFVGNSEVLILDEPSSGLDPDSRVFVWNAIRRYRSERTVLLSTQHMEEADYLGDRIAIMSAGQIICCGSSIFLNKMFGTGYKLRIECQESRRELIIEHIQHYFEKARPLDLLSGHSPKAHSSSSSRDKPVDFVMELKTSKDSEMELIKLLESLETDGPKLGVRSHGLKSSSIEDVMLNTGKYSLTGGSPPTGMVSVNNKMNHIASLVNVGAMYKGTSTFFTQITALMAKFLSSYINDWKSFLLYRFIIPGFAAYVVIQDIGTPVYNPNPANSAIINHFIYYAVLERASKFKAIQMTSQLSASTYWFCFLLADLLTILVNTVIFNILLYYKIPSNVSILKDIHFVLSMAYILFCIAALAFAYALSFIMTDPKTCLGYHYLIYLSSTLAVILANVVSLAIQSSRSKSNSPPAKIEWMSNSARIIGICIFPCDAFEHIVSSLLKEGYVSRSGALLGAVPDLNQLPSAMWIGFTALAVQLIVYGLLTQLVELRNIDLAYYLNFKNICGCLCGSSDSQTHEMRNFHDDSDIVQESSKATSEINNITTRGPKADSAYSLVVARLSKSYIRGTRVIQNLSFTVRKGECFGLLGVNGAGKTTTFSMIAGELGPDEGDIWANGYFVEQIDKYRQQIGYDPQASPDILLTSRQALKLMARLRGVNSDKVDGVVESVVALLDMVEHEDKLAEDLSGGTKRKLALGMSLIGTPQLLALDEPTAGVDPLARRGIWQLLRALREKNKSSIVISSHAMEECEAICDRISIMARGRLRCIGTFLHLHSKFARGCTLRVQLGASYKAGAASRPDRSASERMLAASNTGQIDQVVKDLNELLVASIGATVFKLTDRNVNSATFNVSDNRVRRSILFRLMRDYRLKHPDLNLNYVLNDASLEDIFISLAREEDGSAEVSIR